MKFKPLYVFFLSTLLGLPFFAGCGGSKYGEISGAVTYEGQPVPKGNIVFLPQDGKGPTAAAIIAEGKYSVKVPPGSKQVRIEGFKVLGQQLLHPDDPTSPKVDKLEPMVPAEYNEKSTLKAEIGGGAKCSTFT